MHLYHFWEEKMTRGGQTLVLTMILAIFIEFLPGLTWLVGFLILGSLALSFSFIYSLFSISQIKIMAYPIRSAQENKTALIRIHILNESTRKQHGLGVNWARLPDGLTSSLEIPYADKIESGEQVYLEIPITSDRRGHFHIKSITLLQVDPLGLINRRKEHLIHWNLDVLPAPAQFPEAIWNSKSFFLNTRACGQSS